MKTKAPVLFQIADFIIGDHDFDGETIHQARRVVADTFGTAHSGIQTDAFQTAFVNLERLFGKGGFAVWGTAESSTLLGAVFYNALAISSTDFDEGHRKAVGHPASLVVPVALVLGDSLKASFTEVLQAVIVGYETGTRFSHARIPSRISTYSSGRWGAIASAATAAYLLKLDRSQTIHALSNAAVLSPTMLGGSTDVSTGSMSKEGVAWAAQAGLQSAIMAQSGFSGPFLFVDEVDDYNNEKLVEGLGKSWFINSNYFKPYACCRWLHAAIEAVAVIKSKKDFNIDGIKQIEVDIFSRAIDLVGNKYPENNVQAQFHLPFVLACEILYGKVIPPYFSENYLEKIEIRDLIDNIDLKPSPVFNKSFPDQLPARVGFVLTNNKVISQEIKVAPWDADCQPIDEDLKAKFLDQTGAAGEKLWDDFFT